MKPAIIVLMMLPLFFLLISVLLYLINRSHYQKLIFNFQKKYTLPAPYLLHCNMGYLGSPLMTYFFIRLKKDKKIFFLDKNNHAYHFAHECEHLKAINSLEPLYYTFLLGFFCCLLLAILAILIRLHII